MGGGFTGAGDYTRPVTYRAGGAGCAGGALLAGALGAEPVVVAGDEALLLLAASVGRFQLYAITARIMMASAPAIQPIGAADRSRVTVVLNEGSLYSGSLLVIGIFLFWLPIPVTTARVYGSSGRSIE